MSSLLSPKQPTVNRYRKAAIYLFSFLSLTTICIYVVIHIMLFQNADFQFDEVLPLLKMIGIELVTTACLILLLFCAEWIEVKQPAQKLKKMILG
jgi:hypothetical protein